jgi:hypothetical protein
MSFILTHKFVYSEDICLPPDASVRAANRQHQFRHPHKIIPIMKMFQIKLSTVLSEAYKQVPMPNSEVNEV